LRALWASHMTQLYHLTQPVANRIVAAIGAVLLGLWLAGCASVPSASQATTIRLSDLKPLPTPQLSGLVPLRVSVAAVISPRGTVDSYQPLLSYLSRRLDRPVELVQRRTYSETNELLRRGEVDVAFVCTSAYVRGHDTFGMQLLVVPRVGGVTTYHSVLLVPAGSTAESMADLRGKVFAFTDPTSHTGRIYPTYLVQGLGAAPESFFAKTFFTYNHDDAIRAVASGLADGAAVDSLVYDYALERDPALARQVRAIHRSPPYGNPPVVIGPHAQPQVRTLIEEIIVGMDQDPEGRIVLRHLGVDAFVGTDDGAYDSARELMKRVGPLLP
jgi:phosphonate transport system substrate-binding protein